MINFLKGLPVVKGLFPDPQPPSAGALDALSDDLIIRILSYLPKPYEGSQACRKMHRLTIEERKSQHLEEGIRVDKLAKACGLSSISPICIDVLRSFRVNLPSISARDEGEIRSEFEQLFKGDLTPLRDPIQCGQFLFSRLKADCDKIAKEFFPVFQPQLPDPRTAKLPARARATFEVEKLMKSRRPSAAFWASINESLPLPPSELFLKWPTPSSLQDWQRLYLPNVSHLSSGIGSMTWIRRLSIMDSTCSSFPPSIEQLDLQDLQIYRCPNLLDFPSENLNWIASLKSFVIHTKNIPHLKLLEKVCQLPLENLRVMCFEEPIEHLPKILYEKNSLTSLELSSCTSGLLQEISSLSLKTLDCGFYHSNTLPSSLLDMTSLRKISLLQHTEEEKTALDHSPIVETLRQRGVEVEIEQADWDPTNGRVEIHCGWGVRGFKRI
jgi:hypothetical protein